MNLIIVTQKSMTSDPTQLHKQLPVKQQTVFLSFYPKKKPQVNT